MTLRYMTAKFPGTCSKCKTRFSAGTPIVWAKGVGASHVSDAACHDAEIKAADAKAALPVVAPINLKPLADFLLAAGTRGLKWPAAKFLAPDGGLLRLSVAGPASKAPGSIQVKLGPLCGMGEAWIGRVNVDGTVVGPKLLSSPGVLDTLKAIAADPVMAATAYGRLSGNCSFCSKGLTDAGSVEVGYGKICAKHWGLPWTRKGSAPLTAVPAAA